MAGDTINTMPLPTIDAYQDHGDPEPEPFDGVDIVRANDILDRLAEVGVDYDDVVNTLESEGSGQVRPELGGADRRRQVCLGP